MSSLGLCRGNDKTVFQKLKKLYLLESRAESGNVYNTTNNELSQQESLTYQLRQNSDNSIAVSHRGCSSRPKLGLFVSLGWIIVYCPPILKHRLNIHCVDHHQGLLYVYNFTSSVCVTLW